VSEEIDPDLAGVESELKARAAALHADTRAGLDAEAFMARARRRVAARDMVMFGFAHLFASVIGLFAGVHRQRVGPAEGRGNGSDNR